MNMIAPLLNQKHDLAFSFHCPVVPDGLFVVTAFTGSEGIFSLTEIEVELASKDPDIDLHALIDEKACLTIHHKYDGVRHFSGVVSSAARADEGHHYTAYRLTILPPLHRLRYGSDARIFQQVSVPDIIKTLLAEHDVTDVTWNLAGTHEPREYCVQYRETYLDFIERLAAEEGIWYYFTHGPKGEHFLHFIDDLAAVPAIAACESMEYNANSGASVRGPACTQFSMKEQVRSTGYTQRDYTFKKPAYNQEHKHAAQEVNGVAGKYEMYDYPGRYKASVCGKPFTSNRMEAARVDATTAQGRADTIHLCAGHKLLLSDHPKAAYNDKYLIRRVSHTGFQPGALEQDSGDGGTSYTASFKVQPYRLPYRPARRAKPMVDGPQMAHVTGPAGEEIYCDEYGRVKVQFPWDRYGKKDEHSSCWIRVSQNWAGGSWGHMAIPRIGQEVIVEYLEGDPDQPIITGRTYHEVNKVPNELPKFKTRMVLKSDTHKGSGFNELRFEDEAGQEEVWFHAQKYHNVVVGDDQTHHLKANRHKLVDANQSEDIGGSKDIQVAAAHRESIGATMNLSVGAARKSKIGSSDHTTVASDATELIGGNWTRKVKRNIRTESEAHQQFKAPGTITIDAGDQLVLKAGTVITLNVGGNFIRIDTAGISIDGTLVHINSGVGAPEKGKDVPFIEPSKPSAYAGPHAKRYGRSYEE